MSGAKVSAATLRIRENAREHSACIASLQRTRLAAAALGREVAEDVNEASLADANLELLRSLRGRLVARAERWEQELRQDAAEAARQALQAGVGDGRVQAAAAALQHIRDSLSERQREELAEQSGGGAASGRRAATVRIAARVAADATPAEVARVRDLAGQIGEQAENPLADVWLDMLRTTVTDVNRAANQRAEAVRRARTLRDDVTDVELPDGLATRLARATETADNDIDELVATIHTMVDERRRRADELELVGALSDALRRMGYVVEHGGGELPLTASRPDWKDHTVALAVDAGMVQSRVLRLDNAAATPAERIQDVAVERQWCGTHSDLHDVLATAGIELGDRVVVGPDERAVATVPRGALGLTARRWRRRAADVSERER